MGYQLLRYVIPLLIFFRQGIFVNLRTHPEADGGLYIDLSYVSEVLIPALAYDTTVRALCKARDTSAALGDIPSGLSMFALARAGCKFFFG